MAPRKLTVIDVDETGEGSTVTTAEVETAAVVETEPEPAAPEVQQVPAPAKMPSNLIARLTVGSLQDDGNWYALAASEVVVTEDGSTFLKADSPVRRANGTSVNCNDTVFVKQSFGRLVLDINMENLGTAGVDNSTKKFLPYTSTNLGSCLSVSVIMNHGVTV